MKNVWFLTKAYFRKNKGQTFSMLILITIVALMLNIGLVMFFGLAPFYNQRAEELNAAHFITFQSDEEILAEKLTFIKEYDGVTAVETADVLVGPGGIYLDGSLAPFGLLLVNDANDNQMNQFTYIGEHHPLGEYDITLPYVLFLEGNFSLGDEVILNFWGEQYTFTLAGVTEEVLFGSVMTGLMRLRLAESSFSRLQADFPEAAETMISARLENQNDDILLTAAVTGEFMARAEGVTGMMAISLSLFRDSYLSIVMIIALLLSVFSLILLVVGVVVTRFRIINSIEETMTSIGTLKALGYQSKQIIQAILLQFGLIALIGGLVGIMTSQLLLPILTSALRPMFPLLWNPEFDFANISITLLLVVLVVLAFSYMAVRRIRKLHPLIALRGGLTTHNFKKNPLPLEKRTGPLVLLLAIKQLLQNKKQSIMIGFVISILTFTTIAGITSHYGINVDRDEFMRTVAGQISDVFAIIPDVAKGEAFRERIRSHPDVTRVLGTEFNFIGINDLIVAAEIYDNTEELSPHILVAGRFPRHENEITMGRPLLNTLGKEIGDWVTIGEGDARMDYLITGITQAFTHNGMFIQISLDGIRNIQPEIGLGMSFIYLRDGVDIDAFIDEIRETEGDIFASLGSFTEDFEVQMSTMRDIFALLAVVILMVVVCIVTLVLFLVLKTAILRKRKELGIQKALGFTTFQLMNQIALVLSLPIILGVIAGTIAGIIGFNPLMAATMRGAGIVRINLPIPMDWVIMVSVGLILFAYLISMLVAWRIRKISAYRLVSE